MSHQLVPDECDMNASPSPAHLSERVHDFPVIPRQTKLLHFPEAITSLPTEKSLTSERPYTEQFDENH